MSSSCDDILQCSTAPVVTHQSTLQLPAASHRSASSHSQPSSPQSSARRQHAAVLQSVSVDQSLRAPAAAANHSLLLHYLNSTSTSTRHAAAAAGDSTPAAMSCTPPRRRRRPHASPSRPHVRVHSDVHQSTSRERTPSPCLSVSASLSDSTSPVEWEHRADARCGLRAAAAGAAPPLHS